MPAYRKVFGVKTWPLPYDLWRLWEYIFTFHFQINRVEKLRPLSLAVVVVRPSQSGRLDYLENGFTRTSIPTYNSTGTPDMT